MLAAPKHYQHKEWRDDLTKISNRLWNLLNDQTEFENIRTMVSRNVQLKAYQGQFPARLARWYLNHISVGIRSLVDRDTRTNSFYTLMTDMIDNPVPLRTVSPTGYRRIYASQIKRDRAALSKVSQRLI